MMNEQIIMEAPAEAPVREDSAAGFALSDDIVLEAKPEGQRAEMLRSLRTQLLERHVRCGRRALTVCGASTGVGISFMAANLAVAFSRAGANTLLIDANMRHPAVQRFIIPDRPVAGLSQSLTSGGESLEGAICNGVSGNLSVLYSGGAVPDALEKLSARRFQALIDMCMRDYDITLIDTPPSNQYAHCLRVAGRKGYTLQEKGRAA